MFGCRRAILALAFGLPAIVTCGAAHRTPAAPPDFVALIARLAPAVLAVAGETRTVGSGFAVAPRTVATAAHVADAAGASIAIVISGQRSTARVVRVDQDRDVALLEVGVDVSPVTLAPDDAPARVGEWVIVLGNPFGGGVTATAGIVSAAPGAITATARLAAQIQINAAVNPGNSGGPVCNMRGEVIGMASALMPGGQGLAFVTPASVIRGLLSNASAHR